MKNSALNISHIFLIFVLILTIYISWFMSGVSFLLSLLLYGGIFYIFHIIWRKIRKKEILSFKSFAPLFLKKISSVIALLIFVIWSFWYYHNFFSPAHLPLYTLSNGTQTIEFQTMAHIASKSFYNSVENNIRAAKQDEYVLYFEWVTPWTKENSEAFDRALWIQLWPDTYKNLSTLYWTEAQDNEQFLNIINNKDYNIDISIDTIMEIFNEKNTSTENNWLSSEVYNVSEELFTRLSKLNERELSLVRFMNQAFLNLIMKNNGLRDGIIENFWNTDIFSVILDDRNVHIVNEVINRQDKKIFIIYGLMHFEGVYELLKASDPNWEITNIESFKALSLF